MVDIVLCRVWLRLSLYLGCNLTHTIRHQISSNSLFARLGIEPLETYSNVTEGSFAGPATFRGCRLTDCRACFSRDGLQTRAPSVALK